MRDDDEGTEAVIFKRILPILVALLAGSGLGLGGYSALQTQQIAVDPSARADPWTKTDALTQATELRREIRAAQQDLTNMLERMENRINELEKCRAIIYERLGQILAIINRIEDTRYEWRDEGDK